MRFIAGIGYTKWYWSTMIMGALALEIVALYYQYALSQYPCVLCIHVRIWVFAFVLVGALGLLCSRSRLGLLTANALSLVAAIGLAERSWQTLATERGWSTELACSIDAGLPFWFALDRWLPALFEVQAACGRTPIIAGGITMAEALVAISVAAIAATGAALINGLRTHEQRHGAPVTRVQ